MSSEKTTGKPTSQAYTELQIAYDFFNEHLFENQLPQCLITMQRQKSTFGYFSRNRFVNRHSKKQLDEIAMNPSYFSIRTIPEVLSTLVHEMVHLWQLHYGKSGRRGYHNKEWGTKMEEIGLCPSNTGREGGKRTGEQMDHYIIEGGQFDKVCEELVTKEFTLTWLDRYPPRPPRDDSLALPEFKILTGSDEYNPEEEMTPPEGEDAPIVAPPSEPINTTNRVKYRCPSCRAQVWGKPKLHIICGQKGCNKADFEPVN